MKSRPRNRDTSKADALISRTGDDPEVAEQSASTTPRSVSKPTRKLGKSHPQNKDYHKTMLYLQSDIRAVLAERAFKTPEMDMSDIVNQLLAEKLNIEFIDPNN